MKSVRWSLLVVGFTVALLLSFAAVYSFVVGTSYEDGFYANVAVFRGLSLSCISIAILPFAFVAFLQIPRLPRVGRTAIALLVLGVGIGVAPFVLKYAVKESCLNHHDTWNETRLLCVKANEPS